MSVIPRAVDVIEGLRHALTGVIIGGAAAGVSEALGDVVLSMANLSDSKGDPVHAAGALTLRAAIAVPLFLLGDAFINRLGVSRDPAGGLFFNMAFVLGQQKLTSQLVDYTMVVEHNVLSLVDWSSEPEKACCSDCAEGKACAGK